MSPLSPGQKLRRFRAIIGKTQAEFDNAVGAKQGRTQSYEKINTTVKPKREYIEKIIREFRSLAPSVTVDWFFDGVDDLPPGLSPTAPTSGFFDYPVLQEIPGAGATFSSGTLTSSSTSQYPRGTFWATIGDNDRSPCFLRGDHVLIVQEEALKSDTVFLLKLGDGNFDLFNAERIGGVVVPTGLFDGQADAGDYQVVGKVVELRRSVGGGLIVFQSQTGLSVSMIRSI